MALAADSGTVAPHPIQSSFEYRKPRHGRDQHIGWSVHFMRHPYQRRGEMLGSNDKGQVGDGTTTQRNSPVDVDLGTGFTAKMVSIGRNSACAVLNDDSIKCWGSNEYAQFGTGNQLPSVDNLPTSTALPAGLTAKSVSTCKTESTSTGSACAVMNDDSIWCWGLNSNGLAGVGDIDSYHLRSYAGVLHRRRLRRAERPTRPTRQRRKPRRRGRTRRSRQWI